MPLELNPDIFRAVLESLPIGVYLTDRKLQIAFWNRTAEQITGYLGQEVIGHYCAENLLVHCDENEVTLSGNACQLLQAMQDGHPRDANIFLRHKEGQRIPVRVRSAPIRDDFGLIVGAMECFEERSFRAVEARGGLQREDASLDDITEASGRDATIEGIRAAVEAFAISQEPFGVLSISIDELDHLRHFSGCQAANGVLYATAQTLLNGTRPEDLVGCWRDDRFAVLVVCPSPDALRNCAARLKRLISLISVPWWGDQLTVRVSMGGTIVRPSDTVESLLGRADEALATASAQPDSLLVV